MAGGDGDADTTRKRKRADLVGFPVSAFGGSSTPRPTKQLRPLNALTHVAPPVSPGTGRVAADSSQPASRPRSPALLLPSISRNRQHSLAPLSPAPCIAPRFSVSETKSSMQRLGPLEIMSPHRPPQGPSTKQKMPMLSIGDMETLVKSNQDAEAEAMTEDDEAVHKAIKTRGNSTTHTFSSRLQRLIQRQQASISLFHASIDNQGTSANRAAKLEAMKTHHPSNILDTADVIVEVLSPVLPVRHAAPLFRVRLIKGDEPILNPMWTDSAKDDDDPFLVSSSTRSTPSRSISSAFVSFAPASTGDKPPLSGVAMLLHPRQVADLLATDQGRPAVRVQGDRRILAGLWKPWHEVRLGVGDMDDRAAAVCSLKEPSQVLLCSRYLILKQQD